ncbi:hypothetical protein NAEGRDRAFT_74378 [Naegleria gruberi]|uniref:Actin n=1 Tax=Naegleria gruberi TaxID=5762 RepID=D2VZ68_NAEGR|nr:uncharacterized protein NAEGRDRAFT_74378 [Naegleria gruberi]EFC37888.1 hypothetical protein NAEGRDRAFT_74378 [Naegleria gruberi]|eukprot:XP_002670632.1 hypothetical protein NAEGRDRAFT_74378 [Naegleria gruberi strain NEG-M]
MTDVQSLILDIGSGSIKAGLHFHDEPSLIISSMIGRVKYKPVMMTNVKLGYVGNEAMRRRGILDISYPIRRGIVQDWDDLELLFQYIFESELKVDPHEFSLFLSDSLLNPDSNREKMVELLFETFGIPGLYFEYQPLLSLYSSGRTCGAVLHSGEGLSQIVSISNGYVLPQTIRRLNLGGFDLTEYSRKLLNTKGHCFKMKADFEIVRELKEKCARISLSNDDLQHIDSSELFYELPDGNRIEIGNERFEIGEALFNPQCLGIDSIGIDQLLIDSIQKCEIDTQRDMFGNIILDGGNSRIPNYSTRIVNQVEKSASPSMKVRHVNMSNEYSEWIGAAFMILHSQMNYMWYCREHYDEFGTNFIHKHGETF